MQLLNGICCVCFYCSTAWKHQTSLCLNCCFFSVGLCVFVRVAKYLFWIDRHAQFHTSVRWWATFTDVTVSCNNSKLLHLVQLTLLTFLQTVITISSELHRLNHLVYTTPAAPTYDLPILIAPLLLAWLSLSMRTLTVRLWWWAGNYPMRIFLRTIRRKAHFCSSSSRASPLWLICHGHTEPSLPSDLVW